MTTKESYCSVLYTMFFLKMGNPRPLFRLFSSFQANITILKTNKCEKCPSSIRCWDLNSQTMEHESPPISPGLPPQSFSMALTLYICNVFSNFFSISAMFFLFFLYLHCQVHMLESQIHQKIKMNISNLILPKCTKTGQVRTSLAHYINSLSL